MPPYGGKEVQLQQHRPRNSHSGWTEEWGPVNGPGAYLLRQRCRRELLRDAQKDLINRYRYRWLARPDAQHAIFDFIERWYNNERLHSTLG